MQVAAVLSVCALQLMASMARIERAPIMSDYPMYSTTFASIDEFEQRNPIKPEFAYLAAFEDGGEVDVTRLLGDFRLEEPVRDAYVDIRDRRAPRDRNLKGVDAAAQRLGEHFGRKLKRLIVVIDQEAFNWNTGRFERRFDDERVHVFEFE
jgi:hypothetical protein